MPEINLDDIEVRYGATIALTDVTLTIPTGASMALVGPNGSGKSTLLKVLSGLAEPSRGTVTMPAGTRIAHVLQHTSTPDWLPLTVEEVLRLSRYRDLGLLRRLGRADRLALSEAAARLDIENLRARQFGELSGGQRQRVLVAQALAQQADLLLMDEPITGLDLSSQQRILDIIDQETDQGHTVVITTHHLEEAHHCDLTAVLAGRLVAVGASADVLQIEVLREAYEQELFGAHAGHDHPSRLLLLDDHHHDHDHG